MKRFCRAWVGVVTAAVILSVGGCGFMDDGGDTEDRSDPTLRATAAKVRDAKTLRATFSIKQSGGTLDGGTLTGEADVVAGNGVSVSFAYDTTTGDKSAKVDGNVITVDGKAFVRSSNWKTPPGKKWYSVSPNAPAKLDEPFPPEWFALAMSRILDPLLLLDQGLADVKATTAPDTVDGAATTRYTFAWFVGIDKPGPKLKAWTTQIGDAAQLDISLWIGSDGQPTKLKLESSTAVMQFWADVEFHDYGADTALAAPAEEEVALP